MGGPHPYLVTSIKEVKAVQNRAEQLLLELIYERILSTQPPKPDELGEPATDHYKGYHEGWWDAIEALRNAIDNNRIEENEFRAK